MKGIKRRDCRFHRCCTNVLTEILTLQIETDVRAIDWHAPLTYTHTCKSTLLKSISDWSGNERESL